MSAGRPHWFTCIIVIVSTKPTNLNSLTILAHNFCANGAFRIVALRYAAKRFDGCTQLTTVLLNSSINEFICRNDAVTISCKRRSSAENFGVVPLYIWAVSERHARKSDEFIHVNLQTGVSLSWLFTIDSTVQISFTQIRGDFSLILYISGASLYSTTQQNASMIYLFVFYFIDCLSD
ncbi:hypothetical protein Y032_0045g1219 [Ancylostoma ceylanicum]|uniref:Uncharacterized protein n=1 Tax=Ancylostoma ceylanicum TaxID=53326 RepID=A0A016UEJ2_9BILA|nr:hypothetical protein Y032_0045g1219 [Ancylostoma ceylanicum]